MITRDLLAEQLFRLATEIQAAEERLLSATWDLIWAQDGLRAREAALLTAKGPDDAPLLNGRNEEARKAEMHRLTDNEREAVRRAERRVAEERCSLAGRQASFSAARAVARLLAVEPA